MSDTNHELSPAQFASLLRSVALDPRLSLGQVRLGRMDRRGRRPGGRQEVSTASTPPWSPWPSSSGRSSATTIPAAGAVARLLAWRVAKGLPDFSPDTGGYCKARQRLPESLLPRLVREPADRLEARAAKDWLFHGRRVVIVDGSTATMPDTAENQEAFPQHSNQKRGCGFPIARMVVLLSLATGCVLDAAIGAGKGKLTGEHALLRGDAQAAAARRHPAGRRLLQLVRRGGDAAERRASTW